MILLNGSAVRQFHGAAIIIQITVLTAIINLAPLLKS